MLETIFWLFATALLVAVMAVLTLLFGWWFPAVAILGGILSVWHDGRAKARAKRVRRLMAQ